MHSEEPGQAPGKGKGSGTAGKETTFIFFFAGYFFPTAFLVTTTAAAVAAVVPSTAAAAAVFSYKSIVCGNFVWKKFSFENFWLTQAISFELQKKKEKTWFLFSWVIFLSIDDETFQNLINDSATECYLTVFTSLEPLLLKIL